MRRMAMIITCFVCCSTYAVAMILHLTIGNSQPLPIQSVGTYLSGSGGNDDTIGFEITSIPKFFKDNINLSMARQEGHTCIPYIMAYVNREQCGGVFTARDYIQKYEAGHPNISVEEDGIVGTRREVKEFIQNNFITQSYIDAGGFRRAIDSGHTIMTTTIITGNDGTKELHNILIIGYDSKDSINPKLYYMDPIYGRIFNDFRVTEFNVSDPAYVYVIRGCKN